MSALALANKTRVDRALVKRQICAGRLSVIEAMTLQCCQGATVFCLLQAQKRWAITRASKALAAVPLSEAKRVEDTTAHQREQLAAVLAGRDPAAVPRVRPTRPAPPAPQPINIAPIEPDLFIEDDAA